ncbi:hypothetical protein SASPL_148215 [Salvia splendens]|uniref:Uncharacterized protein n=1 Tax=Salvia splendens TaxID=180675 RepID=A0A8X8W8P8_SALSN|nr:hypothetical protein SASPL_148215 [Salvia splendens]
MDLPALTREALSLTLSFTKETLAFVEKVEAEETRLGYNSRRSEFDSMVTTLGLCDEPIKQCQRNIAGIQPALKEKNRLMLVLLEMGSNAGTYL